AAARLARAAAQAARDARLLLQPVARRRLGTVRAVLPQLAAKVRHFSLKRRNPPLQRGDQLFDFGRENHPILDPDSPPVVSENPPTKVPSTIPVTFRTHPAWELRKKSKSTEFGRRGGQRHFPCLSLGQGPIHFAPKRHVQPRSSGLSPTPKTNLPQRPASAKQKFLICSDTRPGHPLAHLAHIASHRDQVVWRERIVSSSRS